MSGKDEWSVPLSAFARNTFNPIRNIIETLKIEPQPGKPMIALSLGDPTVFGNLNPAPSVVQAIVDTVKSGKHNGYVNSTGTDPARQAVAKYMSIEGAPVHDKDVVITSGCSGALDFCITALCEKNTTLLVPRPGFPLYITLAEALGVKTKFYDLDPERNWEVDLEHLEAQIDPSVAAILVNNPSNPCGSVFSRAHLRAIADIAVKHKIPVIADEIYDNFVFEGLSYHPIASVHPNLPVLACGGLTKRFLVPGWRCGWIAVHSRGVLGEISGGLRALSQRIMGCNTLTQGALPAMLGETPEVFFSDTLRIVQENARLSYSAVQQIPGLTPVVPQGAMYMMVRIEMEKFPEFSTDLEFVEKLVSEQSVFCLPGKCFNIPNFVRIVLTVPMDKMIEACARMKEFCEAHIADGTKKSATNGAVTAVTNGASNAASNGASNGSTNGAAKPVAVLAPVNMERKGVMAPAS